MHAVSVYTCMVQACEVTSGACSLSVDLCAAVLSGRAVVAAVLSGGAAVACSLSGRAVVEKQVSPSAIAVEAVML